MPFNNIRNLLGLPQDDQDIYDTPHFGGSSPQRVPSPTPEMNLQNTAGQRAGLNEAAKNAALIAKMSSPLAYAAGEAGNPQISGNLIDQIDPSHTSLAAGPLVTKLEQATKQASPEVSALQKMIEERKIQVTPEELTKLKFAKMIPGSDPARANLVNKHGGINSFELGIKPGGSEPIGGTLPEYKNIDNLDDLISKVDQEVTKSKFNQILQSPEENTIQQEYINLQNKFKNRLLKGGKTPEEVDKLLTPHIERANNIASVNERPKDKVLYFRNLLK